MIKERFMDQLPEIDMDRTGARLKITRLSSGLAVKDVQKVIGLTSPQAIYKWESGKSMPTIDNLVILAWLYKVRLDDLIVINKMPETNQRTFYISPCAFCNRNDICERTPKYVRSPNPLDSYYICKFFNISKDYLEED